MKVQYNFILVTAETPLSRHSYTLTTNSNINSQVYDWTDKNMNNTLNDGDWSVALWRMSKHVETESVHD